MRTHAAWHVALSRDDWAAGASNLSLLWWDDGYEVYGYGDSVFVEGVSALIERVAEGIDIRLNHRVPAIGFLRREAFPEDSVIVAAGFNGYGGTYCVEAGRLAAQMAITGMTPGEAPEDMFSPNRFLTRRALFE